MKRMRATEELQAQERELRNKDRKILAQFKNEAGDRTGLSPSARPPARPPRPTPPLCLSRMRTHCPSAVASRLASSLYRLTHPPPPVGPPLELPHDVTPAQLLVLVNKLLEQGDEPNPYTFFLDDKEITTALSTLVDDLGMQTEAVLPITCACALVQSIPRRQSRPPAACHGLLLWWRWWCVYVCVEGGRVRQRVRCKSNGPCQTGTSAARSGAAPCMCSQIDRQLHRSAFQCVRIFGASSQLRILRAHTCTPLTPTHSTIPLRSSITTRLAGPLQTNPRPSSGFGQSPGVLPPSRATPTIS